ncbi:MAG: Uma2 family endonuclease [Oculatellaceae cyanobacterium Prado106]|jgi:Uma2 family endonuclease|nr:Uma2 family endonuclease [Oculatellaceae cyanobacterium Prado106]
MTATLIQSPDRVILPHISWQTYQSLVKDFESEPAMRLTYDRGTLEIRMPLDPHETYKKLLGRLIEAATEELDLEIRSLGSRTCDREDLAKGLEPDQCYYIQNEALVREVEQIDLAIYPPPDLAVEIDITSSSLNRFSIYADLGVPEIWRYDGRSLTIHHLQNGKYHLHDQSLALPSLQASEITRLMELRFPKNETQSAVSENALLKQFRQWLSSQRENP